VAIQVSNLAERVLARFETLIQAQLRGGVEAPPYDSKRCPRCDAIVPEIRPVPFEYCPYCEASLDSLMSDARHDSRNPLSRLLGLLLPVPVGESMQPARASVHRG
jgi:hypothetical protein